MARPKTIHPGAQLLEELRAFMPHGFQPGPREPFTLDAGDGLAVTITVRVERRATRDDASRYRNAALDLIATSLAGRRPRCSCYTKPKSGRWPQRSGSRCDARPSAVVVLEDHAGGSSLMLRTEGAAVRAPGYKFVCGRHLQHHGFEPAYVIALVEIPPSSIEGAFQRGRTRYEAERQAKIAASQDPGPPSCQRCGLDRTCNYCNFTGCVTYTPADAPEKEPGR